ncbi:MAG: hypothetical protein D6812_15345 [Deltaproteobacteria bacterium]|nr:MAG: hypothetical protein D6812_15345 [Deltaproteobacteria bacterium]
MALSSRKTRTRKRVKRRDEEPEANEEDEDQVTEPEDDEDGDDYGDGDGDVLTGKDLKSLAKGFGGGFPELGEYLVKVKKVEKTAAKGRMPSVYRVTFKIEEGPTDEPADGWDDVTVDFMPKFSEAQKAEAQTAEDRKRIRQREEIGRQEAAKFLIAALGAPDDDEEVSLPELFRSVKGAEVGVIVSENKAGYQRYRWMEV